MESTQSRQEIVKEQYQKNLITNTFATKSHVSTAIEIALAEEATDDILQDDSVDLEFKSLYQCIHIHSVLGKSEELKILYQENRQLQLNSIHSSSISFKNADDFESLLNDITGFFIIESIVSNTTESFHSISRINISWNQTLLYINRLITENLRECNDPSLYLSIKLLVILFMQTLQGHGYNVDMIGKLMVSLFDRYADLLINECVDKIVSVINNDAYAPMIIDNKTQLNLVLKIYRDQDSNEISSKDYPIQVPFSKGVVDICALIMDFITTFYLFSEGFNQQDNEMDDLMKKSLENIMSVQMSDALLELVNHNNLSQAVQILVNILTFEKALYKFQDVLSNYRFIHKGSKVPVNLSIGFRNIKGVCEKRIFQLFNSKIDEFLELSEYEWYIKVI